MKSEQYRSNLQGKLICRANLSQTVIVGSCWNIRCLKKVDDCIYFMWHNEFG